MITLNIDNGVPLTVGEMINIIGDYISCYGSMDGDYNTTRDIEQCNEEFYKDVMREPISVSIKTEYGKVKTLINGIDFNDGVGGVSFNLVSDDDVDEIYSMKWRDSNRQFVIKEKNSKQTQNGMFTISLMNYATMSFNCTRCMGLYKTKDEAWNSLFELRTDIGEEYSDCRISNMTDGFGVRDADDNILIEAFITLIEDEKNHYFAEEYNRTNV